MNANKLLMSKWTAVQPKNKEKHFLVTDVIKDNDGNIIKCLLEAVYSGNEYALEWRQLTDRQQWLPGWQQAESPAE